MRPWPLLVLILCAGVGCQSRGGAGTLAGPADAGADGDAVEDLAGAGEDGPADGAQDSRGDADLAVRDSGIPDLQVVDAAPMDAGAADKADVNIYVDNFCRMDVVPKSFSVPRGQTLQLTYYNRSRDYPVDVWLSYGGGFLDLKPGTSWADRFTHCAFPRPYRAYADISTACSKYRLIIDCP